MSRDETARDLVEQGALLLDVRSPAEFGGSHLAGAVNLPLDRVDAECGSLDAARPVVVYCRSGVRSSRAAAILRERGFGRVHDMGAMRRWEQGPGLGRYLVPVVLCATLGLAPFVPEPHVIGKLRWIAGGGEGMGLLDVGDLLMHGAPWVLLVAMVLSDILGRRAS